MAAREISVAISLQFLLHKLQQRDKWFFKIEQKNVEMHKVSMAAAKKWVDFIFCIQPSLWFIS